MTDFDALTPTQLRARGSMKWTRRGPEVLPMWVAEMDFPMAPPVQRAIEAGVARGSFGYAEVDDRVPNAFAAFARRRLDMDVNPAWTTVMPHVLSAIEWTLDALAEPGAPVVVVTPAYMHFFTIPGLTGRACVEVPLLEDRTATTCAERWHLDLDAIEQAFADGARALIWCQPFNPVGKVFSHEEQAALAAVVERWGGVVVSDEIHAPLTMPGVRHVAYASSCEAAARHTATVTSASKSFSMPGLPCCTVTLHTQEMADRLAAGVHPDHVYGATSLGIEANVAAFTEGDEWLDGALATIARNARHTLEFVDAELPGVGYVPGDATYFAWLDLRDAGLGDDPAAWLLDHARVWLNPGHDFGEAGRGFCRLNLATTAPILDEGLGRIRDALAGR